MTDAYEFSPEQVKGMASLAVEVEEAVALHGTRLVVEVWDKADSQPVAWIEMHPDDSAPTIRFAKRDEEVTND